MPKEFNTKSSLHVIAEALSEFWSHSNKNPKWNELLNVYGRENFMGEIKNEKDWEKAPRDVLLRVVSLETSSSIYLRWIDPEHSPKGLHLLYHDDMIRNGDEGSFRSGWLKISKKGLITV